MLTFDSDSNVANVNVNLFSVSQDTCGQRSSKVRGSFIKIEKIKSHNVSKCTWSVANGYLCNLLCYFPMCLYLDIL